MARISLLFIVLCVSSPGIFIRGSSQLPRGAAPADATLYAPDGSGQFTCKDGSKSIPFTRVNDDYCDCDDGSDEPGTSACLNGSFYCANKGDESKTLRSMYVDDGICDCCDGTDEPQGRCQNICQEIGKETLKRVEQELADAKIGLSKRSGLEKTAANTRRSWEKRVSELEKMESSKAQQKAAAEIAKKHAESKLERLRTALKRVESQKESIQTEDPPLTDDAVPQEDAVEEDQNKQLLQEEVEEVVEEEEETEEERAKRIASQWIPGQDGAGKDEINNGEEEVYEPPGIDAASDDTVESSSEPDVQIEEPDNNELGLLFAFRMWIKDQIGWITGRVDIDKKLSLAQSKVDAAQKIVDKVRDDFNLKQSDLTTLQNEKSDLEKKLATEYGPSNVFLPIAESCVEANIDKYVYKICPFGDAFQGENGRNTRLGTWSGFEENGSVMSFTDGEGCWQGPSRSIKVALVCGSKDIFESVSEPSRCTYTGVVKTPAYCTQELIASLEQEVLRRKILLSPETPKEEL